MSFLSLRKKRERYNNDLVSGDTESRVFDDSYLRKIAVETIVTAEKSCTTDVLRHSELKVLEIGSAGGITKRLRPGWRTSDVRESPGVDSIFSADQLSVQSSSLDMIYAQDVLHHIENLDSFLSEANRALSAGGIVFCKEPYWGGLAQVVFRLFHPEDFALNRVRIKNSFQSPMSGNQALAWAIASGRTPFSKDFFDSKGFTLHKIGPVLGLAFLLSGGTTFTTKFPRSALKRLHDLESRSKYWLQIFGFGYIFFLRKVRSTTPISYHPSQVNKP